MNRIQKLADSYKNHISVPWRKDTAAAQRVIFCVYNEAEELRLRANIGEFELITKNSGHSWIHIDITTMFSSWLIAQKYALNYFKQPHLIHTLLPRLIDYLYKQFEDKLTSENADENTVVAFSGAASLFGLLKVKDVVDRLAPLSRGRLVVFFPGSFENNNYKLLDGYDGWNYLAIPITADKDF